MTSWSHRGDQRPHFVYRCYDAEGELLYVGCSFHPPTRMLGHESTAWWWGECAQVRNRVYPDRATALERERRAIYEERPRCNVKGRWYRRDPRSDWTERDYLNLHHAVLMTATIVGQNTARLLQDIESELWERFRVMPQSTNKEAQEVSA